MLPVFIATLFLSSSLLFFVQPMVGKMILPILGGSPSVWNTCMVFFQAILLAGYGYAHLSTKYLGIRRQAMVHLVLIIIPLFVLPIAISPQFLTSIPSAEDPTVWLLGVLMLTAGLPFFVISTSAPIVQMWFSKTDHATAHDPYYLYGASNAGSMLGLLAYPFLVEPMAALQTQTHIWHIGYFALVALMVGCVYFLFKRYNLSSNSSSFTTPSVDSRSEALAPMSWKRRAKWLLWAFIPSSLMLGVTTYITTDIASVPLLWVIPLALYLLSFILVYGRRPIFFPPVVGRFMCLGITVLMVVIIFDVGGFYVSILALLHLLIFFVVTMISHGRLAKDRPATDYLTEYFLWISVGGVLGGIFNALIAPLLFSQIYEYMLVLIIACAIREVGVNEQTHSKIQQDLLWVIAVVAIAAAVFGANYILPINSLQVSSLLVMGTVALVVYSAVEEPKRFAMGLFILLLTGVAFQKTTRPIIFQDRNFFGTISVVNNSDKNLRQLVDGNTLHGMEFLDATSCQALSYYHEDGPMKAVFPFSEHPDIERVAIVGLGVGSLTCFAESHQHWDLYEINPAVAYVAKTPQYFQLLSRNKAGSQALILGDARIKLVDAQDQSYDRILMDAFSSNAIPTHLITRQALELYLSKLSEDGIIAFHISNRIMNLRPVLASIAKSLDIPAYAITDIVPVSEQGNGRSSSLWIILAHNEQALRHVANDPRSKRLDYYESRYEWTDTFSNIVSVLKIFQ